MIVPLVRFLFRRQAARSALWHWDESYSRNALPYVREQKLNDKICISGPDRQTGGWIVGSGGSGTYL